MRIALFLLLLLSGVHAVAQESEQTPFDKEVTTLAHLIDNGKIISAEELLPKIKSLISIEDSAYQKHIYAECQADVLANKGNFDAAEETYVTCLTQFKNSEKLSDVLRLHLKLGMLRAFYQYRHLEGLNHFFEGLGYVTEESDIPMAIDLYRGISAINGIQENYANGMEYLNKALKLSLNHKLRKKSTRLFYELSIMQEHIGSLSSAKEYIHQAKEMLEKTPNPGAALIHTINSKHFWHINKRKEALAEFNAALKQLRVERKWKQLVAVIYTNANPKLVNNRASIKELYLMEAVTLCDAQGFVFERLKLNFLLYEAYKELGDTEKSFSRLQAYSRLKDSLINNNVKKEVSKMQAIIDLKVTEDKIKDKERELELSKLRSQQEKASDSLNTWLTTIGLVVLLVLLAMLFFLWSAFTANKRKTAELESTAAELQTSSKKLTMLSLIASKTDGSLLYLDPVGTITWVNESWMKLSGMAQTSFIGKSINEVFNHEFLSTDVFQNDQPNRTQQITINIKGNILWLNCTTTRTDDNNTIVVLTDITNLKQIQATLEDTLREKDTLLKEVHHRVKNNLQIITSLLSLQGKDMKDEESIARFKHTQNRVKAMALVHDKLIQSDSVEYIEMGGYIRSLFEYLKSTYNANSTPINFIYEIGVLNINIDRAIPLGLIMNELCSFMIRIASNSPLTAEIGIKLNGDTQLDFTFNHTDVEKLTEGGFDDKLIKALSKQLNARVEISKIKGTLQYSIYL